MNLRNVWLQAAVAIAIAAIVLLAANSPGLAAEATAAVTAFYATLVFFQLKYIDWQLEDRKAANPKLALKPWNRRVTPQFEKATGKPIAAGCYVCSDLVNFGGSLANYCQPLIVAYAQRIDSEQWTRFANWLPAPIYWSLDELASESEGKPTQERHVVPQRPYSLDLGYATTLSPNDFVVRFLVTPGGQPDRLSPGEHCFEVTVFAENAVPATSWCKITWRGGFTSEELAHKTLIVETLDHPPWK